MTFVSIPIKDPLTSSKNHRSHSCLTPLSSATYLLPATVAQRIPTRSRDSLDSTRNIRSLYKYIDTVLVSTAPIKARQFPTLDYAPLWNQGRTTQCQKGPLNWGVRTRHSLTLLHIAMSIRTLPLSALPSCAVRIKYSSSPSWTLSL